MNRKLLSSLLGVILLLGLAACSSNNSTPPPTEAITVGSGSGQTTAVSTAFNAPLVANVSTGSTPNSGVSVTFTAPSSGAGGTFGSGASTATVTTDANGNATSPTFTANGTAGSYSVVATAQGVTGSATFALTNTSTTVATTSYSFYVAGTDADDFNYTLAGSVSIDSNGNVVSGVQDFNDGGGTDAVISPEPSGDSITGGTLSVNSGTNQGTLTLVTNNATLGTETLAVNFANANHALIAEFDGDATSVGSLDLQTSLSTMPTGAFSFAGAGIDPNGDPLVTGGIFTMTATTLNGTIDIDDDGATELDTAFTATVGTANTTTGRGMLTNSVFGITVVYYIVGPETIRIMGADATNTLVASAYGQGTAGNFSASSIGQSVISVTGTPIFVPYGLAGQITTTPNSETFAGVIDADEFGSFANANPIVGTYAMATDGYGSLTITNGGGGDAANFGVYAVDPNLNINDPNNSTGGGGALVVDLDPEIFGVGVLVPQTDIVAADFSGNYVFDGQFIGAVDEADFAGQGTVTGTTFAGSGVLNDPFGDFVTTALNSSVTFGGTLQADGVNPGRYALDPLDMTVPTVAPFSLTVAVYQASGGQLFWVETDAGSVFSGQIQQQASASSGAKTPPLKASSKH